MSAPHFSRKALLMAASAVMVATAAAPAYAQTSNASGNGQGNGKGTTATSGPAGNSGSPGNNAGASSNAGGKSVNSRANRILVSPYWGDLEAFYGDIEAFYGDINPFYGDIEAFWGDIEAFSGNISPFYGDIEAFWGDIEAFWGDIEAFSGTATTPVYATVGQYWETSGPTLDDVNLKLGRLGLTYLLDMADYNAALASLNTLVNQSEPTWGAAVTAKTGKSFRAGFADPLFAKYGVNLNNASSLQNLSSDEKARLVLDWYDGLMDYTGVDHLDWWMATVNWTPALTQTQGMGSSSVIGLLDATVANDPDIANNLTYIGGGTNVVGGHGTSVASLMVADHDGQGVMGIAPHASVAAFNPFDSSGTASFLDAQDGIVALKGAGASVINMSLGVSGWTLHGDWRPTFDAVGAQTRQSTVFVVAAGNSGSTQVANIAWDFTTAAPALIVVGSVSPNNEVSDFSNRPGTACLTVGGACLEQNRLYNRFIVAPGEMILMSDGQGGLVRRSGTSFSAPIVTGAVALLHDRWPWLANYPNETVDIILGSAKDLGVAGPDPIYGRGLLDIQASQSPLSYSALTFYEVRNGVATQRTAQEVRTAGLQTTWEAEDAYFTLYETIGATQRDFQVPMSSRLVGQKTASLGGAQDYFQSYVTSNLKGWISGTGFTDVASNTVQQPGQWSFTASTSMPQPAFGQRDIVQAPHMAFRMAAPSGRFALNAGHGQGAMVLGGMQSFGMTRDYKSAEGGVNPMLGLASGGAFASVDFGITKSTTLSFGATERRLDHARNPDINDIQRDLLRNVDDYQASALDVRLTQKVTDRLTLSAGYSTLNEANGLLGVQSIERGDLQHGSQSQVANVGVTLQLPAGFGFAASASTSRTQARDEDQTLRTVGDVTGSAYAVAFTKQGLMGDDDLVRFSFSQPLHVDSGKLAFDSVEVVDRQTGQIGVVARTFDLTTQRRYVAETLYAAPLMEGQGELRLFGRAEFQDREAAPDLQVGGALKVRF